MTEPPLWRAASEGDKVKVRELLQRKGVNLEEKDNRYGHTALSIASFKGHLDVVERLVQSGCNVEAQDNNGCTPLMAAAQRGHLHTVIYLVNKGHARVGAKNKKKATATFLALTFNRVNVSVFLAQNGGKIDEWVNGETALMSAAQRGSIHSVMHLISKGLQVNAVNKMRETALHLATAEGHTEVVEHLLLKGADVKLQNVIGDTPLHIAAYENKPEIAKILLCHNADIELRNRKKKNALDIAIKKNHIQIVHLFRLEELKVACIQNNISKMTKMDIKNYVNQHFIDGTTLLITACRCQHVDICKMLLERKANIRQLAQTGESALDEAVKTGNETLVSLLLEHYPDLMGSEIGTNALKLAQELKMDHIVIILQQTVPQKDKDLKKMEDLLAGLGQAVQDTKNKSKEMRKMKARIHDIGKFVQELKQPNAVPIESYDAILRELQQCEQCLEPTSEGSAPEVIDLLKYIKREVGQQRQSMARHNESMARADARHNQSMAHADARHKEFMAYADARHKESMAHVDARHKESMAHNIARHDEVMERMEQHKSDSDTQIVHVQEKLSKVTLTPVMKRMDRLDSDQKEQFENMENNFSELKTTVVDEIGGLKETVHIDTSNTHKVTLACKHSVLRELQDKLVDHASMERDVLECLAPIVPLDDVNKVLGMSPEGRVKYVLICVDRHGDDGVSALIEALKTSHKDTNNLLAKFLQEGVDKCESHST